ncbi:hypothetical protein E3N88_29540 [Mikania micrantha]|uniref:Major facilitator superfamily (MFS) profile domain-containing protein n=1 Tax=Mikania micrantha TaxID=192012 RepID=A0A5N6ML81_9ASTR|nr:hypothetical protein E3N88_29540 [Mikania micrantha]
MGSRSEDIDDTSTPESLLLTAADSFRHTSSPATAVLVISTLVAVSGSFVFGSAVGFSSPAQTEIMDDLGLSLEKYSVFGSILTIGAMVGAVMSGKIADRLGRRTTMGLSELFCLLGWIAIIYSKAVSWLLDVGRLSIGYGIGVLSYVVPVYIAEITPQNLRGAFTTVNQLMICIGVSVMWLIGIFIPWRTLAIIGTIPCLLQLMGLFFIPESPRWLAKLGLWKDCESALYRLRGKDAEIFEEAAEIRDYTGTLNQLSEARVFDLFQPEYAKSLIVGVGLMVLQQFGGVNAIAFYVDSIFISAASIIMFETFIYLFIIGLCSAGSITLLGVLLMDISGRRPLLMVSAAGTCVGCFLTGISFLLQFLNAPELLNVNYKVLYKQIFSGSFSLGMGGIPWVIISEHTLTPTYTSLNVASKTAYRSGNNGTAGIKSPAKAPDNASGPNLGAPCALKHKAHLGDINIASCNPRRDLYKKRGLSAISSEASSHGKRRLVYRSAQVGFIRLSQLFSFLGLGPIAGNSKSID